MILKFLENSTKEAFKPRLSPWSAFKAQMFEIIDHRVANNQELFGGQNANYTTLCEYLILYFIETEESREASERSLMNFLASLKYYSEKWQRAKFFAKLCGFVPLSVFEGAKVFCDIYLQEFYIHAYCLAHRHKDEMIEAKEGSTYLLKTRDEAIQKILIHPFSAPQELMRMNKLIGHSMRRLKKDPLDPVDLEYVDLDEVLVAYVDQFKHARDNQAVKYRKLANRLETERGATVSVERIYGLQKEYKMVRNPPSFVSYPGSISFLRI